MTPPTWIITGASRGFGREIALAALNAGAHVLVTARDVSRLESLKEMGGTSCLTTTCDLSKPEEMTHLVALAQDSFGQVDVVVNNAGSGLVCAAEETRTEDERAMMAIHYHSPMALIRAALPGMRDRRSGLIINIGAAATHGNYAGFSAYGAAKAAMECASEALRAELQPHGIQVSMVLPGPFRTGFIEHAPRAGSSDYRDSVGRFSSVLERMNGRQPGDPARAAELIVSHAIAGTLPFRLPLGAYFIKKLKDRCAALTRDLSAWEDAARATDFPAA